MTGQDPLSSAAEGDDDPGTAALAGAGVGGEDVPGGAGSRDEVDGPSFAEAGPPPEAADDEPVTDAVPETYLGDPETA